MPCASLRAASAFFSAERGQHTNGLPAATQRKTGSQQHACTVSAAQPGAGLSNARPPAPGMPRCSCMEPRKPNADRQRGMRGCVRHARSQRLAQCQPMITTPQQRPAAYTRSIHQQHMLVTSALLQRANCWQLCPADAASSSTPRTLTQQLRNYSSNNTHLSPFPACPPVQCCAPPPKAAPAPLTGQAPAAPPRPQKHTATSQPVLLQKSH
jgi:hypothetical protein